MVSRRVLAILVGFIGCLIASTGCGPSPGAPVSDAGADAPGWVAAWAVPFVATSEHRQSYATDDRGNTFLGNGIPWLEALPAPAPAPRPEVLLSSLDTDGNLRWIARAAGTAASVYGLLPMGDGGVVATLECAGMMVAGEVRCMESSSAPRPWSFAMARFNADGSLGWIRPLHLPYRGSTELARDDSGRVYLLVRNDAGPGTLTSYDARGEILWSRPTLPHEQRLHLVRGPEIRSAWVESNELRTSVLRWTRRGLNGALLARGSFNLGAVGEFAWAPDGTFYVIEPLPPLAGSEPSGGSLRRIEADGRVVWSRGFGGGDFSTTVYASGLSPRWDGGVCVVVSETVTVQSSTPRNTYCNSRSPGSYSQSTYTVRIYSAAGTLLREVGAPYHLDNLTPECSFSSSPEVWVNWRSIRARDLTVGDRSDPSVTVSVLAKYALSTAWPCAAREHRCGGRCVDTATSAEHCGGCGRACRFEHGAVGRCAAGNCIRGGCRDGLADCNLDPADGCETDLRTSVNHCGTCGRACAGACQRGRCCMGVDCVAPFVSDGHEGAFEPMRDVALRAGVHHFTTIDIPAGVTVRVTDGATLDLRASGEVRIAGTIDLSGGDGEIPTATGAGASGGRGGRTGQRALLTGDGADPSAEGGGTGEVRDNLRNPDGTLAPGVPATAGGGVAGGAGGSSYSGVGVPFDGQRCYSLVGRDGAEADGGRTSRASLMGGRGWGEPYEGRGAEEPTRGCVEVHDPFTRTTTAEYTREGVPGGGGSIGRSAVVDLPVFTSFQSGSGGGGGGSDPARCSNNPGGGGGGGGGALRVTSTSRVVVAATGRLLANGGAGAPNAGSGSGGVVYLVAPELRVEAGSVVEAIANGVPATPVTGLGRIRLSVDPSRCTLAGTFNPPLADRCSPTPDGGLAGRTFIAPWPL